MATYDYDTEPDSRPDSGARGLAVAILQAAVQDYRGGNERDRADAGAFLRGLWFSFLADSLQLDAAAVRRRLRL